ncbi:hypothetical protein GCM10023168_17610 [Fodinibacter luteus]|uniref:Copper chaperone PCu(A)C n=1 Tax=Fodinibacter luteus TaxID=552064 RepID=A0ABP8KDJ8_9MICO
MSHPTRPFLPRLGLAAGSAALLVLPLSACASDATTPTSATASASSSTTTAELVLDDGWVKAVPAAADGTAPSSMMTAMFGTVRNPTDHEVTLTGGSSAVAGLVEIHETVRTDSGGMQMQPKPGGIVLPAGGSHTLQPGGDHVMLMDLSAPLESGTTTTVTVTTSDGDIALTVPVRSFTGAEESYVPSPTHS